MEVVSETKALSPPKRLSLLSVSQASRSGGFDSNAADGLGSTMGSKRPSNVSTASRKLSMNIVMVKPDELDSGVDGTSCKG